MNRRFRLSIQGVVLSVAACALLGANGDAGCFESPEKLCANTGGTWGPAATWPTPCGDDPAKVTGAAAKPGESVCTCPADKPNWQNGVGCQLCRIIHCKGTAQWCSDFNASEFMCWQQQGCHYDHGEWRTRCTTIDDDDDDYDNYDPYDDYDDDDDYDSYDPYDDYDNDYDNDYDPYNATIATNDTESCTTYYTGDSCDGFSTSCSTYETASSCGSQRGCYWVP